MNKNVALSLIIALLMLIAVVPPLANPAAAGAGDDPVAAFAAQPLQTQPGSRAAAKKGPIVAEPVAPASFDGDLRDLTAPDQPPDAKPAPIREAPPAREPRHLAGRLDTAAPPDSLSSDTDVQRRAGALNMPAPSVSFNGLNNFDNQAFGGMVLPPDTVGDVGPNHYIQMVNNLAAVYDKSGVRLAGPFQLSSLFAPAATGTPCDTQDQGDPIVLYDSMANRWMLTQFGFEVDFLGIPIPPYYECIAVSKTPNPISGGWWLYAVPAPQAIFNDYPKLGVWPDAYYMSANMFPDSGAPAFPAVWALERTAMLAGLPARAVYFALDSVFWTALPVNLKGDAPPSASPGFFLAAREPGALELWKLYVDWDSPASSSLVGPTSLTVNTFAAACTATRDCVPQPGTAERLDAISPRLMHALQYRRVGNVESLWANHTVTEGGKTAIRWYEIRLQRDGELITPTLNQQSTYGPADGVWRWMGSLAADKDGNAALGFSASSGALFPGIRYAGRLATDTPNLLAQGEITMTAGAGSQTHSSSRWGDYSAMTVDPVDDCTFWYTTEYYTNTSSATWATRIGAFKYASCAPLPPAGFITGTVYNSVTLAPLAQVPIAAANLPMTRTYAGATDANGVYTLTVLPGGYTVTAGPLAGYPVTNSASVGVSSGVTSTANIGLQPFPALVEAGVAITDALPGGNANGYAEPGESNIQLFEGISNVGPITATHVSAHLAALTPGVSVITPTISYADIAPGATITNSAPFGFSIDGGVTCGETIDFQKIITADQSTYSVTFDLDASIAGGSAPVDYASGDVPKAIPDADLAIGATSAITVADSFPVADVNVSLYLTHTWIEDVDLYLVNPDGAQVELSTDNGADGEDYLGTTFDDEAATPIVSGSPPFTGTYRPEGQLSTFDGSDAAGVWKLRVFDDDFIATGTLISWTLTLRQSRCDVAVPNLMIANTVYAESGGNTNANGAIDPGETSIDLDVALTNIGAIAATGVGGTISPLTSTVAMNSAASAYPTIGVGATQTNTTNFNFAVAATHACGIPMPFRIAAATNQGTFYRDFSLPTGAPPVSTTALSHDAESGAEGWTTGGINSTWAITTESSRSPTQAWTDSPGGRYLNNTSSWLQSPALDFSAYDAVTMTFWHTYSLELDFDFGYVEYSIDGGATWNPTGLPAYTGNQTTWSQQTIRLDGLAHQPNARLRFRIFTDGSVVADGWRIDDIDISGGKRLCGAVTVQPEIDVSPAGLTETLVTNASAARTLIISNTNTGSLTWSLAENPNAAWLDEAPAGGVVPPFASAGVVITFTAPSTPNTYTTTLEITSDDADEPLLSVPITLTATLCQSISGLDYAFAPLSPRVGQTVAFTGTVASGTPPITYTWQFGDGTPNGSGLIVNHTFPLTVTAQTYSVTLTAANTCPSSEFVQKPVTVAPITVYLPAILKNYP